MKETTGFDLNLQNVEKRVFRRVQPTPEYLASENLILKFFGRGRSIQKKFVVRKHLNEEHSVDLRLKEVGRLKKLMCKAPFKRETKCSIRRTELPIESYWMIWPGTAENAPVVLYFHGGAFITGTTLLDGYISYLSKLSHLASCKILSVNYRLCPQYTVHDAVDDCERAFDWLIKNQDVKSTRVALAGDSAGGGLCLALL